MKRFFRTADERAYDKVLNRLETVSKAQNLDWANSTLWTIQEGLERGSSDRAGLQQARDGAVALLAAVDSLLDRTD